MPKYSLDDIHYLVRADAWYFGTDRASRKAISLGHDREKVRECLLSLRPRHFRKVYGEAETHYGMLVCDDYVTEFDGLWLYIKFAIHEDDEGHACVVVSYHT